MNDTYLDFCQLYYKHHIGSVLPCAVCGKLPEPEPWDTFDGYESGEPVWALVCGEKGKIPHGHTSFCNAKRIHKAVKEWNDMMGIYEKVIEDDTIEPAVYN